ncbi:MAG: helix-turn-helix domain-containing protein [Candidatus Polarisedimenticolia bacterium]
MRRLGVDLQALGDRLRRSREDRGLTQERLASRSGLTQEMISDMERGTHHPRLDTIEKYARALGISVPALLDA